MPGSGGASAPSAHRRAPSIGPPSAAWGRRSLRSTTAFSRPSPAGTCFGTYAGRVPPTTLSVAIASSADFSDLDESWPLLQSELTAQGCGVLVRQWDDHRVDWSAFDLVLANYAWDYVAARAGFVAWARRVGAVTKLKNGPRAIAWNSEKTYLADLAAAGVAVVPTQFVRPGESWQQPAADFVVKPAVGNGGLDAARYVNTDAAAAERHVHRLHERGDVVVVQPYQGPVDAAGETALIYFGGTYSHAVCKQPLLRPSAGVTDRLFEQHQISPTLPRTDQLATAARALQAAEALVGPLAYARVDLVDSAEAVPLVLELECIEPALYLPHPASARSFVAAVLADC